MVNAEKIRPGSELPSTTLARPDDEPTAAALITAAVEVMSVQGYHGTSVRDIAAAAGTSPGVLYHHFGSKQVLLATMLDRGLDLLVAATEQALDLAGDDPADRLQAIVEAHVRMHLESQRESLLGNSELRALEPGWLRVVIAKRDVQQRIFDRVVRDGVRRGAFAAPHAEDAARFVTAACTAVALWYRPGGPLGPDEIIRRHQEIALDAVRYHR
ncbi:TetR family transcriptional regulator [Nocardia xishanensis]|uniref:TetR family transcriptional regulator n=1 Tax=Nocardia xishanensis TaxID=238964 RepID=A0ABW7X797_9NOCA